MLKKIIKYFLLAASAIIAVFVILVTILYFKTSPTFLDEPRKLSGKIETIEVYNVNWACDCANWIDVKYEQLDPSYETREEDCIFIEPAEKSLLIPESFYENRYGKKIQLVGQFYLDKGIPWSYEMKSEGGKPNKSRVFLYTSYKIIETGN